MPQVVAYEDVKHTRDHEVLSTGQRWRTWFMKPKKPGVPLDPYAFLSQSTAGRKLRTHFHCVDQFQVIMGGGGLIGRHKLAINAVHFARANTPYGPLVAGDEGLAFLTLRSMGDPTGRHRLPEAKEELAKMPNRAKSSRGTQRSSMPLAASQGIRPASPSSMDSAPTVAITGAWR